MIIDRFDLNRPKSLRVDTTTWDPNNLRMAQIAALKADMTATCEAEVWSYYGFFELIKSLLLTYKLHFVSFMSKVDPSDVQIAVYLFYDLIHMERAASGYV